MSIIVKKLSEEIFNILKGNGKSLTLYGDDGNIIYDPSEAVRMYILPEKMMLSITDDDDDISVKLSVGKNVDIKKIENIIKTIRAVCSRLNCLFNIRRFGKEITPKDFAYQVNTNESITEAYYNTLKTTYENVGNCKLIYKHTTNVDESKKGSASRNIKKIYVENENKERILLPVVNVNSARAIARHLSNGGKIYDSVGDYIIESSKEFHVLKNMIKNIRKIKKNIIKPSDHSKISKNIKPIKMVAPDPYVSSIEESIRNRMVEIRNTMKIISGSRNYKKYHDFISTKNNYESSVISEDDNKKLVEFFNENSLDIEDIEYIANVVGVKKSTLPMFIVDDDTMLEISTVYKRRFKYNIDYMIKNNSIIFFNPDCFSEILAYLEDNKKTFEIVSNEEIKIPCNITITSDSISDIVNILHDELGYTTQYNVDGNEIHFKESEVYENLVPLLNISNIKFESKKLNSTYEEKNMAETSNKVLDFAKRWLSDNTETVSFSGDDSVHDKNDINDKPTRLADELSGFMSGQITPTVAKETPRKFSDNKSEIAYKVSIVADSVSQDVLSNFLNVVSEKIRDGKQLSTPEKQISQKAVNSYDKAQSEPDTSDNDNVETPAVPAAANESKRNEFKELEEWFKKFNPDLNEDDAPVSDSDENTIVISLVDDNATISTINKIAELTGTSTDQILSDGKITYSGTADQCDSIIDTLTSVMTQNGDLGSIDISGPNTASDVEANNIVSDIMSDDETANESLSESDIPELERLLAIVESNNDLKSLYIENSGNFNIVNEQTGICFHTIKGNRKLADYYVESFNNENVRQQRKLLKSIIENLIEQAKNPVVKEETSVVIDEQYISELKQCLRETENTKDVSFRVINHEGSYAVVNEQTGIIVNQYSDHTVANKTCENYNENKESSRDHLKSVIEMALSEAEKDLLKDSKYIENKHKEDKINEAVNFAKDNVNVDNVISEHLKAQGSKFLTVTDKFNFVNAISEHLYNETAKNDNFSNIGLNEEYFTSLAETIFNSTVMPVLKEKKLVATISKVVEDKKEDDGIDFSKPVDVSSYDSEDQLKKINKKFKELKKKAADLDSGKADFDVIEFGDKWHVIEKKFPAVCLGEFSTENKARTKAASFISDPEYGVEVLNDNIEDIIDSTDVEEDDKKEISEDLDSDNDTSAADEISDESDTEDTDADTTGLDEEKSFNEILDDAAASINVESMLNDGDFEEPCVVNPHLENVFCARIAQKMYDYVVNNGENVGGLTPNNFMGPASFILHKNIDKFKQAGYEFAENSAYNESECDDTIPTNDQATFKNEVTSDIVTNPEQDEMNRLRKLAGLK